MRNKNLGISEYLDYYGAVLDERQREIIDMYYNDDYSLSEISEITGITRQGVADSIKKSTNKMTLLEAQLHLIERTRAFEGKKAELSAYIENSESDAAKRTELMKIIAELTF